MEDLLKKALDFSNYNQTLSIQRRVLKEKFSAQTTFGFNGGIFHIDRSLIVFVEMMVNNKRSDLILIDLNDNPVLIDDLEKFKSEILDRYFAATYEYHEEYQKIKKNRSVESLTNL